MKIKVYTTGGTIDEVYFDKKSKYEVGEPTIKQILREAQVNFEYECKSLFKKDSLDMTDDDRKLLFDKTSADAHKYVIVIHGTDTMIETARKLIGIPNKVIVLTGAIEGNGADDALMVDQRSVTALTCKNMSVSDSTLIIQMRP
jgi:L-asparaginase